MAAIRIYDSDLIEAGVDNLGDLIKPAGLKKRDGAVKQLYENNEGNQI